MVRQNDDAYDDDLFDEDDEDTQKDMYLTFAVGDEEYGIEIRHVTEIISAQKVTQVPDMPEFVKGVINLRGQVIPVMDVRTRFRKEERPFDDRTCFVVVQMDEAAVGLIVDTVQEVMNIPEENVSPPPKVSSGGSGRFILGMGKVGEQVKILLDVSKLLYEEELAQLQES